MGVIWATGNGGMGPFQDQLLEFHASGGIPRFNPYFSFENDRRYRGWCDFDPS